MASTDPPHHEVDTRHLRRALEFAVLMAEEGQKLRPPLQYPKGLRQFFGRNHLTAQALGRVRRLVEGDATFRHRISKGALPELVDELGRLWLARPDGWRDDVARLAAEADAAAEEADARRQLKKAERRRVAAEEAAARTRAELVILSDQVADRDRLLDDLRADAVKLREELAEVRAELVDARNEVRHTRDRERAALARAAASERARDDALAARTEAEGVRDDALADRAVVASERADLAKLAAVAAALADELGAAAATAAPARDAGPARRARRALPMPGGVLGDSAAATEYLLRSGGSVLVDGYNVAKLGWPGLDLERQRTVLLDAVENVVRRFGCDLTVVFDGADVVGATADRRRVVRVVYSPQGTSADDVLRDEVGRLPPTRPVVVVTNDREIVNDVRAMGANTLSSDQLVAVLR